MANLDANRGLIPLPRQVALGPAHTPLEVRRLTGSRALVVAAVVMAAVVLAAMVVAAVVLAAVVMVA